MTVVVTVIIELIANKDTPEKATQRYIPIAVEWSFSFELARGYKGG